MGSIHWGQERNRGQLGELTGLWTRGVSETCRLARGPNALCSFIRSLGSSLKACLYGAPLLKPVSAPILPT